MNNAIVTIYEWVDWVYNYIKWHRAPVSINRSTTYEMSEKEFEYISIWSTVEESRHRIQSLLDYKQNGTQIDEDSLEDSPLGYEWSF